MPRAFIQTVLANWKSLLIFTVQVVALSCALGIAIDLVTANVAVEYFTVHHPHVVDSDSPWIMALVWGVIASWWAGLILAPFIWFVNIKRKEPLPMRRLLTMVMKGMVAIWLVMMAILIAVYLIGGLVPLHARRPSFESDRRLMAVALSHMTEYVLSGIVTLIVCLRIWRLKVLDASRSSHEATSGA